MFKSMIKTALVLSVAFSATSLMAKNKDADCGQLKMAEVLATEQLKKFDTLDFDVYSHQKWDRMGESHAKDIKVYWPDGHVEQGLDKHIESLKPMFVYMPDLTITEHPVRIGNGEWTAVIGHMVGTFTKPMDIGGGKFIQPTGNKLDMKMATIGHWTKAGVMDEEYLFWDSKEFMRQLGVGQ